MVVTYQLLGMGDAFLHGFVLLLRLFEGVRVVLVKDVLGVSIIRQVSCWMGYPSVLIMDWLFLIVSRGCSRT